MLMSSQRSVVTPRQMSGSQWFQGEVQGAPNSAGAAMGALQRLQNQAWFQGQPQARQAMAQAAADPRWFRAQAPTPIQQQAPLQAQSSMQQQAIPQPNSRWFQADAPTPIQQQAAAPAAAPAAAVAQAPPPAAVAQAPPPPAVQAQSVRPSPPAPTPNQHLQASRPSQPVQSGASRSTNKPSAPKSSPPALSASPVNKSKAAGKGAAGKAGGGLAKVKGTLGGTKAGASTESQSVEASRLALHRVCEQCAVEYQENWRLRQQFEQFLSKLNGADRMRIAAEASMMGVAAAAKARESLMRSLPMSAPKNPATMTVEQVKTMSDTKAKEMQVYVHESSQIKAALEMLQRGGKHGGIDTSSWKEAMSQSPPRSQSPQRPASGGYSADSPPEGYTASAGAPVLTSTNPWTSAAKEAARRPPATQSQQSAPAALPTDGSAPQSGPVTDSVHHPYMKIEEVTIHVPSRSPTQPGDGHGWVPTPGGPAQMGGPPPQQQPGGQQPGAPWGPANHPVNQEFARVDTNSDGNISQAEFMAAYGGQNPSGSGYRYPPPSAGQQAGVAPIGSFEAQAPPSTSHQPSSTRVNGSADSVPASGEANNRRPSLATLLEQRISKGTQDAIRAGLMQTRVRGSLSQDTQDAIKAGLLKTQVSGNLSQDTQDAIKAGLLKKQMRDKVRAELQDEIRKGLQTVSGLNK